MAKTALSYMSGFGNEFATEALSGALPEGRNSPQRIKYNLYNEQLTGTPFTMPRAQNQRAWLYRIRPSVVHQPYEPYRHKFFKSAPFDEVETPPNQLRWSPVDIPKKKTDFIDGVVTIAGNGNSYAWTGLGIHVYAANASMEKRFFYNADGEMLFVPQKGRTIFRTELGVIEAEPTEIVVIPRGIKFAIDLPDGPSYGYICENYGLPLVLPDLGPIGANGLGNPRDFLYPVAAYEEYDGACEVIAKFGGNLWRADYNHSPLDIVAWHGNYAPYKYDLKNFNAVNTVTFDHPDPSIFTVLTSQSYPHGTANVDFVIFPPRWTVALYTFRPPWYHRNVMSEFMGLIYGVYDGKESAEGGGFTPGGASLHNCMAGHGPDTAAFEKAIKAELKPHYIDNALAFMFESRYIMRPTRFALESTILQKDYYKCWQGLHKYFGGGKK